MRVLLQLTAGCSYTSEMGTMRGYLSQINNSLTQYVSDTAVNNNGCSALNDALTQLSAAAYFMQGQQLASNAGSQGGSMMPLLVSLAYEDQCGERKVVDALPQVRPYQHVERGVLLCAAL